MTELTKLLYNGDLPQIPLGTSPLAAVVVARWAEVEAALRVLPDDPLSPDQLLTPAVLAKLLAVSPRTLETWRKDGRGPEVTRIAGMPRYRYSDVLHWVAHQNPK